MERIDDLDCNGYRIIQDTEGFCFGVDAVLLANYAVKAVECEMSLLDLCSGNGIIPILIAAKTDIKSLTGIEIQADACEIARKSVLLNSCQERINIINSDLNRIEEIIKAGSMDIVTVNPPYVKNDGGLKSRDQKKLIARHEIMCTLEDVIRAASYALKSGGKLFMVHRPYRIVDIFVLMRKYRLEPKELKPVYSGERSNIILIEGVKNGGQELKILPPEILHGS